MSRTRHPTVLFCLLAVLVSACPDAGENPDIGKDGGPVAEAGTDMAANNELGGSTAQPAAPSGGRGATAGSVASAAGKASSMNAAAGGGGEAGAEDDAGSASPPATKDCVVGGCSNQLCTDAANGAAISTCEWREEYGCYRAATCAKQSSGQCGWTQTPELMQCLQEAGRP